VAATLAALASAHAGNPLVTNIFTADLGVLVGRP
jgi:hypothetical protein